MKTAIEQKIVTKMKRENRRRKMREREGKKTRLNNDRGKKEGERKN